MFRLNTILVTLLLLASGLAMAQQPVQKPVIEMHNTLAAKPSPALAEAEMGPVIENYGPAYPISKGAMNLKPGKRYKVLFDVSASGDFAMESNQALESSARFMNMHAQNGIDPDDLKVTVVVHGAATKDLLNNEAYRQEFGVYNPNTRLLEALQEGGVEILVCGQSASHKGYAADDFHTSIGMALSAMTAHIRLQSEGYYLIPF